MKHWTVLSHQAITMYICILLSYSNTCCSYPTLFSLCHQPSVESKPTPTQNSSPNLLANKPQTNQAAGGDSASTTAAAAAAPKEDKPKPAAKKFVAPTTSKYRHMQAALMARTTQVYDIKNVSISTFGECDGFHANRKWGAVPLGGPGGMIAIIDVSDTKRSSEIIKFSVDPFFVLMVHF